MSRIDRFCELYSTVGLCTDDHSLGRAEIMAYCAGMDMLEDMLGVVIDEEHTSKGCVADYDELKKFIGDDPLDFGIDKKYICLYLYNPDTIGIVTKNWLSPFCKVILNGDGLPWSKINLSWSEFNRRSYRWSMLDTIYARED